MDYAITPKKRSFNARKIDQLRHIKTSPHQYSGVLQLELKEVSI